MQRPPTMGLAMMRSPNWLLLLLFSASLQACGAPTPTDLLGDERVQTAIRAYHDGGGVCSWGCNNLNGDSTCTDEEFNDGDAVLGTWTFDAASCHTTASDTGYGVGDRCSGTVTFRGVEGNRVEQENSGGVSTGSGEVAFATRHSRPKGFGSWDRAYTVLQKNHAVGAGCTQDIINLISFLHLDEAYAMPGMDVVAAGGWDLCTLNVILDSQGCDPHVAWTVREAWGGHSD